MLPFLSVSEWVVSKQGYSIAAKLVAPNWLWPNQLLFHSTSFTWWSSRNVYGALLWLQGAYRWGDTKWPPALYQAYYVALDNLRHLEKAFWLSLSVHVNTVSKPSVQDTHESGLCVFGRAMVSLSISPKVHNNNGPSITSTVYPLTVACLALKRCVLIYC